MKSAFRNLLSIATILFSCCLYAAEPAADAVEGAWVVTVGEGGRDRFMVIHGATLDKGQVLVARTEYGYVDGKGKPVRDWKAEVAGDSIELNFITPGDSKVSVTFKLTETSVAGEMLTKKGVRHFVRMTRIPAEELAALRTVAKTPPSVTVTKGTRITFLYIGAGDCSACRRYESEFVGPGKKLSELLPEMDDLQYVKAQTWSFRDKLAPSDLPDYLQSLVQPGPTGRPALRKYGAPYFAAVVDGKVLAQGHGTTALQALVLPALKGAAASKRALN